MAYTAAAVGFFACALGWVVAGFLPEPQFANHDEDEEETTAPDKSKEKDE